MASRWAAGEAECVFRKTSYVCFHHKAPVIAVTVTEGIPDESKRALEDASACANSTCCCFYLRSNWWIQPC